MKVKLYASILFVVWLGSPALAARRQRAPFSKPAPALKPAPVPKPAPALKPSARPSGHIAFVSTRDGHREVYVMNADGSGARRLVGGSPSGHLDSYDPAWSPDGKRIAFSGQPSFRLDIINWDGSGITELPNHADGWEPAWSPDGKRIAFARKDGETVWIYITSVDGSTYGRVTADAGQPAWSPDGKKLAVVKWINGRAQIFTVNVDGSYPAQLTNLPYDSEYPAWAPDGNSILFTSNRDAWNWQIYTMKPDGSNQRRISSNIAPDFFASWSPDGKQIAFRSDADGGTHVYIMNADGSGRTRVGASTSSDERPAWSRLPEPANPAPGTGVQPNNGVQPDNGVPPDNSVPAPTTPHRLSLTDGLIGQWGIGSHEAPGSHQNPSKIIGGVTTDSQGAVFNGKDGVILIPDADNLKPAKSFAISVRVIVLPLKPGSKEPIIFWGGGPPGASSSSLTVTRDTDGHSYLRFAVASATDESDVIAPIIIGQETHIAAMLDDNSGEMTLFINGKLAGRGTTTIRPLQEAAPAQSAATAIGNTPNFAKDNEPFHGVIRDVRIYNRALSGDEIMSLFRRKP
ncbi:MAG: hypothetical protein M3Y56_06330 [Armatimonadota bacterium]|nr:hypothetical protein [Armatimonadota bacterium]